ncbi:hypothetical protein GCM10025856_27500 [Methylophaga marina]|uniref:HEPN domain-containing protein n=1 Tax=Methylophaga marina TaxID=45495 RepID=A0ABN0TGG0_9GAMM|nr:hypothetical protein [Methylophaga marina]BDZ75031.1 hypothetical protein GCM10025856_27500 [Methylophaga marina]
MVKNLDEKLNDGHIIEALDRLHFACVYTDEFLGNHPLIKSVPEFANEITKAAEVLESLYQKIGSIESSKHINIE